MRIRLFALLLAVLLLLPCLFACADTKDEDPDATGNEVEVETDPFADVDFGEREFWIYTSVNAASTGMGNSNFMIEGDPEPDS